MPEPLFVLVRFVLLFIEVLSFAMLFRALFSWFFEGESGLTRFLYVVTEPVVIPIRKLFVKLNWFQDSPFDFSFTLAFLALWLYEMILTSVIP
jgi:uncharacterized protein YggT (Ycf19 family)